MYKINRSSAHFLLDSHCMFLHVFIGVISLLGGQNVPFHALFNENNDKFSP